MEKEIIINRICNRYKMHNQEDYVNGWIDFNTLRCANEAANAFKNVLGSLMDSELVNFYRLDKKAQNKVFDWDSACYCSIDNQNVVKDIIPLVERDIEKSGLGIIPVIKHIMSMELESLKDYANAKFERLANGVVAYYFNEMED